MRLPSLPIFIPAFLLSILSLVVTISISPANFQSQLIFLILGIFVFFLISTIDINMILVLSPFFYLINLILLIITLLFGQNIRGSSRWLNLGFINLQSSELVKISLITLFAYLSTKLTLKTFYGFFTYILILTFIALLVLIEPDLGTTLVIISLGFYLILNLKPAFKFIAILILLSAIILPFSYTTLKPYQKERIENFLNPSKDPLGASYNQVQAIIAVGSGQLFGKGLGQGTQSHLHFLPEKDTDFFFAATVEEFGFVGSVAIILLFIILSLILLKYSSYSPDEFKIIFLGCFFAIFIQASIHIGINIGLFPVTGITLPFMSVGGSSMITFWLLLSIASSTAKFTKENNAIYLK